MAGRHRQARIPVVGLATLAMFASLGSCLVGPERECEKADEHCADGVAYTCAAYAAGTSGGTKWDPKRCASAEHCRTYQYGAFCTLDPAPYPECAGQTVALCDATHAVVCQAGYRVEWAACAACSADQRTCDQGVWKQCGSGNGSCLPGLVCENGFCEIPCTCPEGSECPACEQYGAIAGQLFRCKSSICRVEPLPL